MERGLADAGDTLAAGTREFVLARYGVLCLMCQPMALDRGSCPEVLWLCTLLSATACTTTAEPPVPVADVAANLSFIPEIASKDACTFFLEAA